MLDTGADTVSCPFADPAAGRGVCWLCAAGGGGGVGAGAGGASVPRPRWEGAGEAEAALSCGCVSATATLNPAGGGNGAASIQESAERTRLTTITSEGWPCVKAGCRQEWML